MTTYPFLDVNIISVDSGNHFWWGGYVITIFDVTTTSPLAVTIILVDCDHCFWCDHTWWFGRDVFVLIVRFQTCSHMDNVICFTCSNYRSLFLLAACLEIGHPMFWSCPRAKVGRHNVFQIILESWNRGSVPPPVRCIQLFELGSEAALPDSEHTSCTLCSWTEVVVCIPMSKTYIPWQGPPQGPAPVVS